MAANKRLNWSYQDADQFLLGGRNRDYRNTGERNTAVIRRGHDAISLQYHFTNVVTWYQDGRIVINTGGWMTATTKQRINDYSPVTVWQKNYFWYVGDNGPWDGSPLEVVAAATVTV